MNDGHERLGDGGAVFVDIATIYATRQGVRAWNRNLDRRGREFSHTPIFGDDAQSFRCGKRFQALVTSALIMGRWSPHAALRQRVQSGEKVVEAQIEIDAS